MCRARAWAENRKIRIVSLRNVGAALLDQTVELPNLIQQLQTGYIQALEELARTCS